MGICSHIENLFTGVLKGFCYKMRFVYSHFPINVTLNGNTIEIRNFLGEKRVRKVDLMDGVEYTRTSDVKDQIELTGNDIASVSLTAAKINKLLILGIRIYVNFWMVFMLVRRDLLKARMMSKQNYTYFFFIDFILQ